MIPSYLVEARHSQAAGEDIRGHKALDTYLEEHRYIRELGHHLHIALDWHSHPVHRKPDRLGHRQTLLEDRCRMPYPRE